MYGQIKPNVNCRRQYLINRANIKMMYPYIKLFYYTKILAKKHKAIESKKKYAVLCKSLIYKLINLQEKKSQKEIKKNINFFDFLLCHFKIHLYLYSLNK